MKKFVIACLLALLPPAAFSAPYELLITQRNSTDTGYFGRNVVPPSPSPNTSGIFMYDGGTTLPMHGQLGAGLSWSGTTLSVSVQASSISDSTATGRSLMTAADAAAARSVIGAGTGNGTVTSITAGTGLSGGVITSVGTISLPNTGTAGTYSRVTTDAQGRVTAGTDISINDAPGRAMVTATNATGFQISSTRVADVCYEGTFQTTSTIGGPAAITVFLETADTNSTTPGDWTTKAQQQNSNTVTLAVALQQVDVEPWSLCRKIPAGKFVRIRSGNVTGTAAATINTQQQETLL